jgi:hypothetical protein
METQADAVSTLRQYEWRAPCCKHNIGFAIEVAISNPDQDIDSVLEKFGPIFSKISGINGRTDVVKNATTLARYWYMHQQCDNKEPMMRLAPSRVE